MGLSLHPATLPLAPALPASHDEPHRCTSVPATCSGAACNKSNQKQRAGGFCKLAASTVAALHLLQLGLRGPALHAHTTSGAFPAPRPPPELGNLGNKGLPSCGARCTEEPPAAHKLTPDAQAAVQAAATPLLAQQRNCPGGQGAQAGGGHEGQRGCAEALLIVGLLSCCDGWLPVCNY